MAAEICDVAVVGVGLAEVAAKFGALRFEGGGDKQVFTTAGIIAQPDTRDTAAEPRIAEGGIHGEGGGETVKRTAGPVLREENKAFQREGLGVARGQRETLIQRGHGRTSSAETAGNRLGEKQ